MTTDADISELTRAFETHDLDNSTFGHAQHVEVAFGLLKKYDFIDAASTYAKGIQAIAWKAGAPKKFNLTITYAFMSLIAERMMSSHQGFDDFAAQNPDLMSKGILARWYAPDRLHSDTARSVFLLPDPADSVA